MFAASPDPDFQGARSLRAIPSTGKALSTGDSHYCIVLLQIGAALRPAFGPDTPPHVTAMACQVTSTYQYWCHHCMCQISVNFCVSIIVIKSHQL